MELLKESNQQKNITPTEIRTSRDNQAKKYAHTRAV